MKYYHIYTTNKDMSKLSFCAFFDNSVELKDFVLLHLEPRYGWDWEEIIHPDDIPW